MKNRKNPPVMDDNWFFSEPERKEDSQRPIGYRPPDNNIDDLFAGMEPNRPRKSRRQRRKTGLIITVCILAALLVIGGIVLTISLILGSDSYEDPEDEPYQVATTEDEDDAPAPTFAPALPVPTAPAPAPTNPGPDPTYDMIQPTGDPDLPTLPVQSIPPEGLQFANSVAAMIRPAVEANGHERFFGEP